MINLVHTKIKSTYHSTSYGDTKSWTKSFMSLSRYVTKMSNHMNGEPVQHYNIKYCFHVSCCFHVITMLSTSSLYWEIC
uniref:Uncharacterized protein n=1 Tax=Anguilla anguilla TaxID=7936 RepID=A0A0E9WFF8_ANGAN